MTRRTYPLHRYPKYRTSLNAGGASVGISVFKSNPVKYIRLAELRPIKILRYGHLSGLLISPEFYDSLATDLQAARDEVANLLYLLNKISPDLAFAWQHNPAEFIPNLTKRQDQTPKKLPPLAKDYVLGIEELLDDMNNEDENPPQQLDPNLRRLIEQLKRNAGL